MRDIERGDRVKGDILETEVVERRVLENEIETRILLRMEIVTGEHIDDQIVESEIVDRDMTDPSSGAPMNDEGFESGTEDPNSGADSAKSAETAVNVTKDDEGKSVVNTYDEQIRIVSEVRAGTLYVDPNPGLTEKIKSSFGWGDADDDETYPVEAEYIESITDDEVKISCL